MLHGKLHTAATVMTAWPGNVIGDGHANHGIITVGHCGTKYETLKSDYIAPESPRFFQLEPPFPLPDDLIAEFCDDLALCLIIEEGEPFVEEQVRALLQRRGLPVRVLGRQTGTMPDKLDVAGVDIFRALNQCMPEICLSDAEPPEPAPPVRLSEFALEPDCPFYDVCQVLRICMEAAPGGLPRLVGEPGCNVRLRLPPFDLFEYRVAMGSGTGVAAGLAAGDETRRAVAVIGDSAFVHSGLSPLVDAVRHGRKALIIIMDNGVLGVTGCQSGPSTGNNAVDLPGLCRACGVEKVEVVTTHDKEQLATVFNEALAANDLRVLILSYPCSRCVDNLKQG